MTSLKQLLSTYVPVFIKLSNKLAIASRLTVKGIVATKSSSEWKTEKPRSVKNAIPPGVDVESFGSADSMDLSVHSLDISSLLSGHS